MEFFIIAILIGFFIFGFFAFRVYLGSKKKISKEKYDFFQKKFEAISKESSYKTQILDMDVLYHKILLEVGYKGTFGEILKQDPMVVDDLDEIWKLHKLRNKLAHEFDILEETILKRKSHEFKKALQKLLKKIS